jgi:thiamine pyrophosphate-dependent acetolactate synthase large subunit-like protein
MSMGERIVALLRQAGVEAVFSQGDITTRDVLKHAQRAGMQVVGPRHEASTIFSAMGYYAVTGKVQAAFGAMGPGVANLLPSAVAAAREHLPVMIFGATRHRGVAYAVRRGQWLSAPLEPVFARLCKFSTVIAHPAEVDEAIRQALRAALTGTPGPVYIEYDATMHVQQWDYPELESLERYRTLPGKLAQDTLADAVHMLSAASAPVLLVGEAVQHQQARHLAVALAERLGCPIVPTFAGSGVVPWAHPHALQFESGPGQEAIAGSDLLLAVGTCFPENVNYGRLAAFQQNDANRRCILVDGDAAAVGLNRPVDLALIGALPAVLAQLHQAIAPRPANPRLPQWKQMQQEERQQAIHALPTRSAIHPSRLMLQAREAVPDSAAIVVDGGLTIFHQHAFFEKRAGHFVYGAHYSHLGCGLAQAIGVQLALGRQTPVCLLSGDGALGFHIMELETAVRHQLPIVVIVNDDRALGAEVAAHLNHIGHTIEVEFSPVRYDRMMEAIGGHGEYVERLEDIQPAVRRAFASGRTALVQVTTDPEAAHREPHPYADARANWINADVKDRYGS